MTSKYSNYPKTPTCMLVTYPQEIERSVMIVHMFEDEKPYLYRVVYSLLLKTFQKLTSKTKGPCLK